MSGYEVNIHGGEGKNNTLEAFRRSPFGQVIKILDGLSLKGVQHWVLSHWGFLVWHISEVLQMSTIFTVTNAFILLLKCQFCQTEKPK